MEWFKAKVDTAKGSVSLEVREMGKEELERMKLKSIRPWRWVKDRLGRVFILRST